MRRLKVKQVASLSKFKQLLGVEFTPRAGVVAQIPDYWVRLSHNPTATRRAGESQRLWDPVTSGDSEAAGGEMAPGSSRKAD